MMCDQSELVSTKASTPEDLPCEKLVVDEENLPFEENSIDLMLSS